MSEDEMTYLHQWICKAEEDLLVVRQLMSADILVKGAIAYHCQQSAHFGYIVRNEELEFFVKDTGIGIEKDEVNSIFVRFVKVDPGPSNLTEGSGLGLYLNALLTRETDVKVLHASNGREAIELFKANPGIILILMDIKMPEIDGLEATRQIKLINKDVPVIAITAYAMSGDEERVLAAGCDGYLSKPLSKKMLLQKVGEYIDI